MLLAIDAGNTQTVFGLFEGEQLARAVQGRHRAAAHRRRACSPDPGLRRPRGLDGIVLSSTVPQLVREYEGFADRGGGLRPALVLGPGVSTGVPIRYDDPREVGPDRIANSVAARERPERQ
jgi:type III pantothenate kinase